MLDDMYTSIIGLQQIDRRLRTSHQLRMITFFQKNCAANRTRVSSNSPYFVWDTDFIRQVWRIYYSKNYFILLV